MKDTLNYTLDMIGAYGFGMMAALALYGVIALGAWWHIGTAVICAVLAVAMWNAAIVDENEPDLE